MLRKIFLLLTLTFLSFTRQAQAFKAETFVTFANPVRGPEGWQHSQQGPLELPLYQYQESTHSAFPVTWLLRYDAVEDATISAFFQNLSETDHHQSLGAFLEITPSLTAAAEVSYPAGNLFFNANRIFLSGYSIGDREKLIDTYMESFFVRFGFYPKSVSAWHLDSTSLQYLQSKYSVLTAMNCDDQYTTDHYRIWGGYLGSPYFPDKNNSLVPADSSKNRVNLAMVRWAQRDLFNFYGYRSESSYSVQVNDYLSMGQNTAYFENLLAQYGQKSFNEFTYLNIGLENDYDLKSYKAEIKNVYQLLKKDQGQFNLHFISLADFGDWFKARYPESSPAYYYQSADPKGLSSGQVYWYQSPYYRLGLQSENGVTQIIDFRVYNREIYEDFFATPNQSLDLFHEIPAIIDSIKYPGTELSLDLDLAQATSVHSKQWDNWQIAFKSGDQTLTLEPDKITFSGFSAPKVSSKDIQVTRHQSLTTWNLTPYTPFKDSSHPTWLLWLIILIALILIIKKIKKSNIPAPRTNYFALITFLIALLAGLTVFRNGLLYPFGMGFWGPNGHDAIFHLSIIENFSSHPLSFAHPQIAGERIANYHFLFDYLSGLSVKLFGISSLDFYFRLFPLLAGIAIVFLLDKLLKSWLFSRSERFLSLLLVFLAGSFGFIPKLLTGQDFFVGESAFWANQSVSIFLNPPFVLSIVLLLLFLVILSEKSLPALGGKDLTPRNNKHTFFLILLGGLLAQTKIYAFILLLGALLLSKKYKLFFGVLLIGVLISLPFTVLGGTFPFVFSPLWFPRALFASFDRFYWPQLVSAWQVYEASGNFIKLGLVNLFALTVFLVGNLGFRFLGLIQMALTQFRTTSESLVRWLILLGLLIPLLFTQSANPWNTIQFMYYALFFLGIFTAKAILSLTKRFSAPIANNLTLITLIILATLTSIGTLKDYFSFFSASRLSYTELSALDKLRDQPRGLVLAPLFSLATSRSLSAPKPLYSYVSTAYISALSAQPEFLSDTINLDITGFRYQERAKEIQRFYQTEDKLWALDFLQKNNIRYVYETPLKRLKLAPADLQLTKIFDSGEINVYKFN
jgi:hypothetical protein